MFEDLLYVFFRVLSENSNAGRSCSSRMMRGGNHSIHLYYCIVHTCRYTFSPFFAFHCCLPLPHSFTIPQAIKQFKMSFHPPVQLEHRLPPSLGPSPQGGRLNYVSIAQFGISHLLFLSLCHYPARLGNPVCLFSGFPRVKHGQAHVALRLHGMTLFVYFIAGVILKPAMTISLLLFTFNTAVRRSMKDCRPSFMSSAFHDFGHILMNSLFWRPVRPLFPLDGRLQKYCAQPSGAALATFRASSIAFPIVPRLGYILHRPIDKLPRAH